MDTTELTCIVIPCYNEEARLRTDVICDYIAKQPAIHLLFVNDGSKDHTEDVLRGIAGRFPEQTSVLSLERNSGKAEAVRRGLLQCIEKEFAFVGYWDADLATPLEEIERFLKVMQNREEIHFVLGSRIKLLGKDIQRSAMRHYLGRVFATAASVVLKLPVYDTQCGAKLFRVSEALRLSLREPFLSKWIFDVELIARLTSPKEGPTIEVSALFEQPLEQWHDIAGSKVKPKDFLKAALELLRIRQHYF